MDRQQQVPAPNSRVRLPGGMTPKEAVFLLEVYARLKERRSGRLEVTVSDGRVVDVELVERLDRKTLALSHNLE